MKVIAVSEIFIALAPPPRLDKWINSQLIWQKKELPMNFKQEAHNIGYNCTRG